MIKEFSILVSAVLLLASFVLVHYVLNSFNSSNSTLESIVKITNFSSPSLSVSYYEPRILLYDKMLNPAYPQIQTINKMDFIYAN